MREYCDKISYNKSAGIRNGTIRRYKHHIAQYMFVFYGNSIILTSLEVEEYDISSKVNRLTTSDISIMF